MRKKLFSIVVASSSIFLLACTQEATPTISENSAAKTVEPPPEPVKPAALQKFDGPFGLRMGLTDVEVKKYISDLQPSEKPGGFNASTVPTPHPSFESYSLQFSEKSGLCSITGIGRDIESSDTGAEVKAAFSSLDEALTAKYGVGKKYDFSNQRYDSPEFWMLHLLKKNRTLAKFWDREEKSNLPESIRTIALQAHASGISKAFINIRYEFSNIDDCIAERKNKINKAL